MSIYCNISLFLDSTWAFDTLNINNYTIYTVPDLRSYEFYIDNYSTESDYYLRYRTYWNSMLFKRTFIESNHKPPWFAIYKLIDNDEELFCISPNVSSELYYYVATVPDYITFSEVDYKNNSY